VPLLVEVPAPTLALEGSHELTRALQDTLDGFQLQLGLPLPRIAIHARTDASQWRLLAYEVPMAHGDWPSGNAPRALAEAVRQTLRRHAALFIGVQETTTLLTRAQADLPDVVKEVLRVLPVQKVAEVLRRLVAEEVSIRNLRDILEALSEAGQREKDVLALTEFSRISLKRQISHQVAPSARLRTLLLAPEVEDVLRQSVRVTAGVSQLALDPAIARELVEAIALQVQELHPGALLTSVDLRWHLRKLIEPECFDTPVLSFHELAQGVEVETVGRIAMPRSVLLEAA
jgi:type III secretion protein V